MKSWFRAAPIALLCALPFSEQASSDEVVQANDQFYIFRDFSKLSISEEQAKSVRAFVDVGAGSANSVSSRELQEIKNIAVQQLKSRVRLVSQKDEANLLVQTRMYQTKNYHVRNSKQEPSHGLILISACRFPIRETTADCENLNYYYFADYQADDIFQNVFSMWLNSVFPRSQISWLCRAADQ